MEKLKLHTPDLVADKIDKLAELFPSCITEMRDDQDKLIKAIDFDQLRQELSKQIVDGPRERYHLDWPGKRESILAANAAISRTLRPYAAESVNFDTTRNLFIEGDNLDALKLLQETYLNKVTMIYIDPPYNTGRDFLYDDHFAVDAEQYFRLSQQKDELLRPMVVNPDSNGRFHSDWLTMMYPRLKLARNLLSEDGIMFISIDNKEIANLHALCAEIFGGGNIVSIIANVNNPKGRSDDKFVATAHEYLLVVAKSISTLKTYGFVPGDHITRRYRKTDETGARYREIDLRKTGDNDRREDRPNLFYYFCFNKQSGDLFPTREEDVPADYVQIKPIKESGEEGNWRWGIDTAKADIKKLVARFMPNRKIWGVFEKDYLQGRDLVKPTSAWTFKEVNSERGSEQFVELGFEKEVFLRPKPVGLIRKMLDIATSSDGKQIVLDFFAGSGTTAEAVMRQNLSDGGSRRFILVQIPDQLEVTNKTHKAAIDVCDELGKPRTIAEITKERIRRAAASCELPSEDAFEEPDQGSILRRGDGGSEGECDCGFRVLKVDISNMEDVYYTPDDSKQEHLLNAINNIREDRTPEDLLFQVLGDWGVDLALPITRETIDGKTVFFVDGNALAACFDQDVTDDLIKDIAKRKPLRAVFRDSGYSSDSVKINVEQIFKLLAPSTEIRSL
jgi:adenine-specific DNA-methyltransferase